MLGGARPRGPLWRCVDRLAAARPRAGCTGLLQHWQLTTHRHHASLRNDAPLRAEAEPITRGTATSAGTSFTDIVSDSWFNRLLPEWVVPYSQLARWDRPIGTWLLLWPCLWSIALATPAGAVPDPAICGLFATGAVLMRGAGCTVNDIWDRDLDRLVERTRHRPLAAGTLGVHHAIGFLCAQLSVALGVVLALPLPAVAAGLAATPLWVGYPLAKRFTDWPQAVLGVAFNWGAMLGWVAVQGSVYLPVVAPLYAGCFFWTLHYDTIYAYQDHRDDVKAGIRSTALRLADQTPVYLRAFDACVIASLGASACAAGVGSEPLFWAGLVATYVHLEWQRRNINYSSPAECLRLFRSNREVGLLIFLAIALAKLSQRQQQDDAEPFGAKATNSALAKEERSWRQMTGYEMLGLVMETGDMNELKAILCR